MPFLVRPSHPLVSRRRARARLKFQIAVFPVYYTQGVENLVGKKLRRHGLSINVTVGTNDCVSRVTHKLKNQRTSARLLKPPL